MKRPILLLLPLFATLQSTRGLITPQTQHHQQQQARGASSWKAHYDINEAASIKAEDPHPSSVQPHGYAAGRTETTERSTTRTFLQRYSVTLLTALTVTLGATLSASLPLSEIGRRMRRDILAGAIIFSVGDWGAQVLTWRSQRQNQRQQQKPQLIVGRSTSSLFSLDQQRLVISTILGGFWAGICTPFVYATIERFLPGAVSFQQLLLKMIISCSILSTAGNYFTLLFRRWTQQVCDFVGNKEQTSFSLVKSKFRACVRHCNQDIGEVSTDDLKVWPLYDILCFAVIPPSLRPMSTALMSSLWSMYMSIVSAKTSVPVVSLEGDGGKKDPHPHAPGQESSAPAQDMNNMMMDRHLPDVAEDRGLVEVAETSITV